MNKVALWVLMAALLVLNSCGQEDGSSDSAVPQSVAHPAEDFFLPSTIKADGISFNRNRLIDDEVFSDHLYLSEDQVQLFLEQTPYGTRCFLADYQEEGTSAARILVQAAANNKINPLVLLAKLQVEMSLISTEDLPSDYRLNHALGCGCPDGSPCSEAYSGFGKQVLCAGEKFRSYLTDMDTNGKTVTGWAAGRKSRTLDPLEVTPANRATAALYTYTPWVLEGQGGNWLFWNIFNRYSDFILEKYPNHHWIGGSCTTNEICPFSDGVCIEESQDGMCSKPCMGFCPDTIAANTAVTFCTDLGSPLNGEPAGWCVSRCNTALYQENKGCRPGYTCVKRARYLHEDVVRNICWPDSLLTEDQELVP